jgi:hypothetical protein
MPFAMRWGGGPSGLPLGCTALVLLPVLGLGWVWLQVRALRDGDRARWPSLAAILAFAPVAAFVVFTMWKGRPGPMGYYDRVVFLLSLGGLVLLPLTLGQEALKYWRDRPPPRDRRPPRPFSRPRPRG